MGISRNGSTIEYQELLLSRVQNSSGASLPTRQFQNSPKEANGLCGNLRYIRIHYASFSLPSFSFYFLGCHQVYQ